MKDHERGDIVKIDWLDRLAFRTIEQVHQAESAKSDQLFLYVDLPRFDFPVVYSEQVRQTGENFQLTLSGKPHTSTAHAGPLVPYPGPCNHIRTAR